MRRSELVEVDGRVRIHFGAGKLESSILGAILVGSNSWHAK